MRLSFVLTVLTGTTCLVSAAFAQERPVLLDEITVTASGLPTEVMRSPSTVSVLTAAEIEKKPYASVAQILRDIPGVLVTEDGIERVRIRGESSRRVAISIDGQKLTDHSGYGQPILIDPASIERIEVVRGAASVVSGTQAIGGAVNIITKRGADVPFAATMSAGYYSATQGYRSALSMGGSQGAFDWRLSLGKSDYDDRKSPKGRLTPSDISDESLTAHLGWQSGNHYFALKGNAFNLGANVYTGDDDFIIELPKRDLRKLGLHYEGTDLTPWLTKLSADIYRQTIDREFRNDVTVAIPMGPPPAPVGGLNVRSTSVDEQLTSGLNITAEMQFAEGQRTVLGFEYEDDNLETDKTSITTMTGFGPFPIVTNSVRSADATVQTTSLFAQHEVDFTPELTGTFGARYDHVKARLNSSVEDGVARPSTERSDSRLLGSVGLVWSPDDSTSLRGSISQGYIFPTLQQLFLTTTGGGRTIQGNPDLKPETATTFELGARLQRDAGLLDATLFYTDSDDYIASIDTGPRTAAYSNVDKARTWGLELYGEYDTGVWGLTSYASVTAMRRELEFGSGVTTFDSGTPELFGRAGLRKDWTRGDMSGSFDLFVRGEGPAKGANDAGTVTDSAAGYATLNLHGDIAFANGAVITAELNNLLDKSYDPIDQMPGAERNVNIFVNYRF